MGILMVTQNNAAISATRTQQDRIQLALIGFLSSNGRLPCPDVAVPPTDAQPASCWVNAGRGVLPWQAVGL